jgi:hypothetical protein
MRLRPGGMQRGSPQLHDRRLHRTPVRERRGIAAGLRLAGVFLRDRAGAFFDEIGGETIRCCNLETFWRNVSNAAAFSPLHKSSFDRALTGWGMDSSPTYHLMDLMSRVFSPYTLNPLNINPMRNIIEDTLDFEAIQACSIIKIFIAATHVASGHVRVFGCEEITVDSL